MPIYTGINEKSKKISNVYIGINGQAKKVQSIYYGINGHASLIYPVKDTKIAILNTGSAYKINYLNIGSSITTNYNVANNLSSYPIYSNAANANTLKNLDTSANKILLLTSNNAQNFFWHNTSAANINLDHWDLTYLYNLTNFFAARNLEGNINKININDKIEYKFTFENSKYYTNNYQKLKIQLNIPNLKMTSFMQNFIAPNLDVEINGDNIYSISMILQRGTINSFTLHANNLAFAGAAFNNSNINYIKINTFFNQSVSLLQGSNCNNVSLNIGGNNFYQLFGSFRGGGYAYLYPSDNNINTTKILNRNSGIPFYIWIHNNSLCNKIKNNIAVSNKLNMSFTSTLSTMPDNSSKTYLGYYNSKYNTWILYGDPI